MSKTRSSLIRRVRDAQDAAGWAEFVVFYEPLLCSFVRARGVPVTDVADIVQEIFLKLLRALPDFELDPSKGKFRTWLYQVTLSAVYDHARRKATQDRTVAGWWDQVGKDRVADEAPPEDWHKAHQRRAVELAEVQVKDRANANTWYCYEQHFHHGRGFAEIAAELEITANAASVNAGRVLDKIRAVSAEKLEELSDE